MRLPHKLWQREPHTAKRVRHTFLVSEKGVAAARRRRAVGAQPLHVVEPGKCVIRREHEANSGVVQLCRGHARKSILHPLLGGGRCKTDHKGWRGAEITRRGARFGTASVGGGSRVLTLGGGRCVQGRPEVSGTSRGLRDLWRDHERESLRERDGQRSACEREKE